MSWNAAIGRDRELNRFWIRSVLMLLLLSYRLEMIFKAVGNLYRFTACSANPA
jgi:hypothetical protein